MPKVKLQYKKPWLPIAALVQKLKDLDKATGERRFIDGITFEDIADLCLFDAQLRDCYSEALEMVELSLRSAIAFHFGKAYGAFGHLAPANFVKSFSKPVPCKGGRSRIVNPYKEWLKKLEGVIDGFLTRFPKLAPHSGFTPVWKKNPLWWQV